MTTYNTLPPTLANKKTINILGIDPGYDRLGIACIQKNHDDERVVHSECFSPAKGELDVRLREVWERLSEVMTRYEPDIVAIESVFSEKNVKTVIGVAQVLGLIKAQCFAHNLPVYVFTPLQIKSAVTGNGRATKAEVAKMTRLLVQLSAKKMIDDEMDAIAVALTASAHVKDIHIVR